MKALIRNFNQLKYSAMAKQHKKNRIYNQASLFGPLYAYLVVISPPETIKNDISNIKKRWHSISDIGERNLQSIGHITLTDRLTDDADFAETVGQFIKGQSKFEIHLKGIGIFDHGLKKTAYLKIANSEPVIHLMALVKSVAKSPHLSLAKNLPTVHFDKLKNEFETFHFEAKWICEEVIVLRKLMSEKHLGFREKFVIPLK